MDRFEIRGVIEAFYGSPWNQAERLDMLDFISKCKMNTYFLAPKDDPGQRLNWRTPISQKSVENLRELIYLGQTLGINLGTAISPGQDIAYADRNEFIALKSRLEQYAEIGFKYLGIFLDDIPNDFQSEIDANQFTSLAAAHAFIGNELGNWLHRDFPLTKFVICPNIYHGTGSEEYVVELGNLLSPNIEIFWTGIQICSYRLDSRDAVIFTESAKRKPLFWDNYPVNDVAMVNELHIGPLRARERDLYKFSSGLLANPMLQAEASKIPLWTIGEYLSNPSDYDPELAWERALSVVINDENDRNAFKAFARNSLGSCLNEESSPEFAKEIAEVTYKYRRGDLSPAISKLHSMANTIRLVSETLKRPNFTNQKLVNETSFWIDHYQRGGEILELVANNLSEKPSIELIEKLADEVSTWRSRIYGDSLHMFLLELKEFMIYRYFH